MIFCSSYVFLFPQALVCQILQGEKCDLYSQDDDSTRPSCLQTGHDHKASNGPISRKQQGKGEISCWSKSQLPG